MTPSPAKSDDTLPSIKRKRVAASVTSAVLMIVLLPIVDFVYRLTSRWNPGVADYVFFGVWSLAALLCVLGFIRRERFVPVILSAIILPFPLLFWGIAG